MILSHIYSDNKIFQNEMEERNKLRKQRRKKFLNKIYENSFKKIFVKS